MTHAYSHIIFLVSGIYFYLILKKLRFNSIVITTVSILYLLHPRIYAHSFFNIKDLIFLSLTTITSYYFLISTKNKSIKQTVLLAFFSALATNSRIMGLIFPVAFLLWTIFVSYLERINLKQTLKSISCYVFLFSTFSVVLFPTLWSNPIVEMTESFRTFSKYEMWQGNVIYNGQLISGSELPMAYIPIWIIITSPSSYLLLWGIGLIYIILKLKNIKQFFNTNHVEKLYILFPLFILTSSFTAITYFRSTLYGDWRHVYYFFPMLMIISAYGLDWIHSNYSQLFKFTLLATSIFSFLQIVWMVKNHPHSYVYFNQNIKIDWSTKFDRDFWRTSTKQSLERIALSVDEGKIAEVASNSEAEIFSWTLDDDLKNKIKIVPISEADFLIGNYRNIIGEYEQNYFTDFSPFSTIYVDSMPISKIFIRN